VRLLLLSLSLLVAEWNLTNLIIVPSLSITNRTQSNDKSSNPMNILPNLLKTGPPLLNTKVASPRCLRTVHHLRPRRRRSVRSITPLAKTKHHNHNHNHNTAGNNSTNISASSSQQ
jgi:hypothetical protein